MSKGGLMLSRLLLTDADVSKAFAVWLRKKRESRKWSREALAARSLVPASTIKKFELTGRISFRQLLTLWQCLDDIGVLYDVVDPKKRTEVKIPQTIEEVLKDEF
ncbi:helix-turn-helix domain-containing protein [Morganella morganii]|uniref:helix-turn-helix domain-containing protein n=1 Tax=Morganella morganii TaxID=582 RepID=UPI0032DAE522